MSNNKTSSSASPAVPDNNKALAGIRADTLLADEDVPS